MDSDHSEILVFEHSCEPVSVFEMKGEGKVLYKKRTHDEDDDNLYSIHEEISELFGRLPAKSQSLMQVSIDQDAGIISICESSTDETGNVHERSRSRKLKASGYKNRNLSGDWMKVVCSDGCPARLQIISWREVPGVLDWNKRNASSIGVLRIYDIAFKETGGAPVLFLVLEDFPQAEFGHGELLYQDMFTMLETFAKDFVRSSNESSHLKVCPSNIFREERGCFKLGLPCNAEDPMLSVSTQPSVSREDGEAHCSPEVVYHKSEMMRNSAADVYSLAATVLLMASPEPQPATPSSLLMANIYLQPRPGQTLEEQEDFVRSANMQMEERWPLSTKRLRKMLCRMMNFDQRERPTWKDVVAQVKKARNCYENFRKQRYWAMDFSDFPVAKESSNFDMNSFDR